MPRELSTDPKYVRKRIRDSAKDINRDIAILYGKPVSEWDFEELQRGRIREADGTFRRGRKPTWITDAVMGEVRRRLKDVTRDELAMYTQASLETMKSLMTDDSVDNNGRPITSSTVKLAAAQYVIDQIIGKPTTSVEVAGTIDVQQFLARVMVNADGEDAHPIVEGAVEEEVDDGDDD